MMYFN